MCMQACCEPAAAAPLPGLFFFSRALHPGLPHGASSCRTITRYCLLFLLYSFVICFFFFFGDYDVQHGVRTARWALTLNGEWLEREQV